MKKHVYLLFTISLISLNIFSMNKEELANKHRMKALLTFFMTSINKETKEKNNAQKLIEEGKKALMIGFDFPGGSPFHDPMQPLQPATPEEFETYHGLRI